MAHILIVEDNGLVRKALYEILRREHEVAVAEDGLVALHRMDEQAPDLMLVDLLMPNMDGLELLETIRQRPVCPKVIFMSSVDLTELLLFNAAWCNGDILALQKPFSPRELMANITQALQM